MRPLSIALYATLAVGVIAVQPWLNISLPYEERLLSYIAQLNDTRKFDMVQGDSNESVGNGVNSCVGHVAGDNTLGIPDICMGDGPAGVGNALKNVTTFPAPIVAASSWNTSVQYAFGQAMAREHMGKGRNLVLAPTINIVRSPLWARAAESFSEDPWLTARMAVASIEGIQSQGALACPKHLAAYNQETNRFGLDPEWVAVDSQVDQRVMHELYLPAFKASIQEADAASLMCSYNKINGHYSCENDWLLNATLKQEWGFEGFVLSDWYFATRSTVASAMAGLDISMPGGDLTGKYGLPAYYGDLLVEAISNGSVPHSRLDDMVERIWRYMFKLGQIDKPVTGNALSPVRTQAHLDLAQQMAEDGSVLLKNEGEVLPLSATKYSKLAIFGVDATNQSQVGEAHGGFSSDSTMVVQAPLDALRRRGALENITVEYAEAYPGTAQFPSIPSTMFKTGGLNVTYFTTTDFSGPVNQTGFVSSIISAQYPSVLWQSWPQVFSAIYKATFLANTSGTYLFSITGQGSALLYLDEVLVANMSFANFGNTVQGAAYLKAGSEVSLVLKYSMGYSLSTGAYGVTLGVDVGNTTRDAEADALAEWADVSIIFASDRFTEGADNGLGLSLPGNQDAVIARLSKLSKKTVVVLQTNSAVLMPWLADVDAVLEAWYAGQQVGLALERLMFGDISPSGKLPVTFPKTLEDAIQISTNLDVPYSEGLYVGYKAYDRSGVEPLFPFGHGLTYSKFSLRCLMVSVNVSHVIAEVVLKNNGAVDAREVVQLYIGYPQAAKEPLKLLRAFDKVELAARKSTIVQMAVKYDDLNVWEESIEDWKLVHGKYNAMVGFSASDIKIQKTFEL